MIKPRLSTWNFADRERRLFDSASKGIPTWRLANQSRRLLADVVRQLLDRIPEPAVSTVDKLDAEPARQRAATQLASIVVRSAGAQLTLVSCGYEREALGQARPMLEALIRIRQINDDSSGAIARTILSARRPGSLKTAAIRYGNKHEIELLDHFAHADIRTLIPLTDRATRSEGRANLELRPIRGQMQPGQLLYESSYACVQTAVATCEVFGVGLEISPWISGQLKHYRDNPLPIQPASDPALASVAEWDARQEVKREPARPSSTLDEEL